MTDAGSNSSSEQYLSDISYEDWFANSMNWSSPSFGNFPFVSGVQMLSPRINIIELLYEG
jgi:hypothetical protein